MPTSKSSTEGQAGDSAPDAVSEDARQEKKEAKADASLRDRAEADLRIVRRRLREANWEMDGRTQFHLAQANLYALLDLADAVRGMAAASGGTASSD